MGTQPCAVVPCVGCAGGRLFGASRGGRRTMEDGGRWRTEDDV